MNLVRGTPLSRYEAVLNLCVRKRCCCCGYLDGFRLFVKQSPVSLLIFSSRLKVAQIFASCNSRGSSIESVLRISPKFK